jgi:ComF family protein
MQVLRTIFDLAELLWPSRCVACGAKIPVADSDAPASLFCKLCGESLLPIVSPRCPRCALAFEGRGPDHLCGECLAEAPAFQEAVALFQYGEAAADAVMRLKYGQMPHLAAPLGKALLHGVRQLSPADFVVPVPLHRKRLIHRGFNQSALLARPVARALGLPLKGNIVCRTRETVPQTGLSRDERKKNLLGAFEIRRQRSIAGKRILLIDDVITTGATVRELSRVLVRAGAESVRVAAVARAC